MLRMLTTLTVTVWASRASETRRCFFFIWCCWKKVYCERNLRLTNKWDRERFGCYWLWESLVVNVYVVLREKTNFFVCRLCLMAFPKLVGEKRSLLCCCSSWNNKKDIHHLILPWLARPCILDRALECLAEPFAHDVYLVLQDQKMERVRIGTRETSLVECSNVTPCCHYSIRGCIFFSESFQLPPLTNVQFQEFHEEIKKRQPQVRLCSFKQ